MPGARSHDQRLGWWWWATMMMTMIIIVGQSHPFQTAASGPGVLANVPARVGTVKLVQLVTFVKGLRLNAHQRLGKGNVSQGMARMKGIVANGVNSVRNHHGSEARATHKGALRNDRQGTVGRQRDAFQGRATFQHAISNRLQLPSLTEIQRHEGRATAETKVTQSPNRCGKVIKRYQRSTTVKGIATDGFQRRFWRGWWIRLLLLL
mmetsp:Transcript_22088/g.50899  ORF Transcript_22088/g.50899 Transcript_22088/m.50899 type:complete len:207 (+) Transcript_22088:516-1136(+)